MIVFKFVEFDKNWKRVVTSNVTFEAQNDPSLLTVVAEDETGVKTTYWFKLPKGSFVDISWYHNQIFIPAKCVKKDAGDQTKCRE